MLQTVRAEKVHEKNWVIYLIPCFLPEVWSLNCPKNRNFLQFCSNLSKKQSVKAIYIYASQSSHYILLENYMVYRGLGYRSRDIIN